MRINQIPLNTTKLSAKLALSFVLLYVLVLFPAIRFTYPTALWVLDSGVWIFSGASIALLIGLKQITWKDLGLTPNRKYLLFAAILIGSIAFLPFALNSLISLTGINQVEFFADAINNRAPGFRTIPPWVIIETVFLIPLLTQIFLIGIVTQQIMKKRNTITGIYGAGILFMLLQFDFSIGLFIIGCLSAYLFKKTGTLYPSIGLHMGCALAGLMIANVYPRLYTVVGLLY